MLASKHLVNVFCQGGDFSYQQDHVLKHHHIARCHTRKTFIRDAATFREFYNLILPHLGILTTGKLSL